MNHPDPRSRPRRAVVRSSSRPAGVGPRCRGADQAGPHRLVRRQRRRVRPPVRGDGRERDAEEAQSGEAAEQLPRAAPIRPTSRASRTARSSAARRRRTPARPTTGSRRRRCAQTLRRLFDGCMRGPHDVRGAVLDGAARQPHRAHRHRALRQPVRRRQHEADDAHGARRVRRAGQRRRLRALRALGGRAARRRAGRRAVAVQQGPQVHRPLSRDARDLVVTARATAATRCSARSASRCASPR